MTTYEMILEKLKNHKYAEITPEDYAQLARELVNDFRAHDLNGDKIPDDYFELQTWVYNRVAKDMIYQRMSYLNEHFCIGAIFGMLRMFDEFDGSMVFDLTKYELEQK